MASLREKLRIKPKVEELQKIQVVIPAATKLDSVRISKVAIVDERANDEFNKNDLLEFAKRLEDARMKKVTVKPTIKMIADQEAGPITIKKKVKKLISKKLKLVQEGDVNEEEQKEDVLAQPSKPPHQKEGVSDISDLEGGDEDKEGEKNKEGEEKKQEEEEVPLAIIKPKVKRARAKKLPKGVSLLSPEEWIDIGDTPIIDRLPEKMAKVQYKVGSYYMNNREIFINAVNALFEPYREQILDDTSQITCDNIGSDASKFSLLIHQMVVRDYMNLYSPYRGLLLYHGLGSGKTCTSIALAEGMKSGKKIIIMTPASLRPNYISELKKCGDALYKTNQFWEWIDVVEHPEAIPTLSAILNLSVDYINANGGAWLVNVTKPKPYPILSPTEKTSLDNQINEMIESKYKFINYNGLRRSKLKEMTNNFEVNLFDDAVIVIDEAHNLISRIVNKLGKEKPIPIDERTGLIEKRPLSLALNLYQDLLSAKNAKIILLTGTPIINYPNEVAILFNILRGYIKQWEFTLDIKSSAPVNDRTLHDMFIKERLLTMDYLEYSSTTKKMLVTRNPFGFENNIKKLKPKEKDEKYHGVSVSDQHMSDEEFERNVVRILKDNDIIIHARPIIHSFTALPDKLEDFVNLYIDSATLNIKNEEMLKKRIMGLTSYFRSAQEKLLPRYDKLTDYHVIRIPMSDYQFTIYENARKQERKTEQDGKRKKPKMDENGIYKEPTSTYRIFSRLFCNFVMPNPPGRPLPIHNKKSLEVDDDGVVGEVKESNELAELYVNVNKERTKTVEGAAEELGEDKDEVELEGDQIIDNIGDSTYIKRMQDAIKYVEQHAAEYLSPRGLEMYSPKYLNMLERITDPDNRGLHLVYSQFRTLEGIGMFKMVLEHNGFTQFRIKKDASGEWELAISEEDMGKPTFALYTGTETKEEKEMVRNIYNGDWSKLTPAFARELTKISRNNNMGEIIKVFMITASGSEGINLRNTRFVHIMEPYWHPARMEQVIGRARRICSHTELPEQFQTVEVFIYLMTLSQEQIDGEASIELKIKDLSKRPYNTKLKSGKEKMDLVPFTSDQALYEISMIKEEVSMKLTTAIKESSIDCALYSKSGSKEQLHCLQFGNPSPNNFSYKPDYKKDTEDRSLIINKEKIKWKGQEVTLRGKKYISRKMPETRETYLYDHDSYMRALEVPGVEPVLVAIIKINENGEKELRKV